MKTITPTKTVCYKDGKPVDRLIFKSFDEDITDEQAIELMRLDVFGFAKERIIVREELV